MNRLRREFSIFLACPRPMRILLGANMIYALVLPVVEIFVAAYVLRNSHSPARIFAYQLAVYAATPVAFLLNGLLLGRVAAKHLYAAGMLISGVAMMAMMQLGAVSLLGVALTGLAMGLATGLFWANRVVMALANTQDRNRNYYYGLELFWATLASVLVPAAIGWLMAGTLNRGWLSGQPNRAYRLVALGFMVLSAAAALLLEQGQFRKLEPRRFLYLRFHPLWRGMLGLAALKGMAQGYILAAPAILVMMFVGQEGTLGAVQAIGGVLSAILMYTVGRAAGVRARQAIFAAGLTLFLLAAAANALCFNALGVLLFLACMLPAKQLLDLGYNTIELGAVETVSRLEARDSYAYLFSHDLGLFVGRALGCGLFLAIACWGSQQAAVRWALLVVGVAQWLSVPLARWVLQRQGLRNRE